MRLSNLLVSVSLALGTLMFTGCPGPEYPKCDNDSQCKKNKDGAAIDEYCLLGQCQQCAKDSHCGAGETCNRGRCEQTCASDDQCGAGNICENRRCIAAQCTSNDACGTGATCEQGRCKRPTVASINRDAPVTGPMEDACDTKARVNFDFNVADLRPDARSRLDSFAKCLQKNTGWRLTIEGHADERGTPEYNLSLGESRAKSVRKYLSALGIDEKRMKIVSYGEERPLNPASTEEAWAENRRAELIVSP